jgi:hypothetical protein
LKVLFGWKNSSQKCAQLKFMTSSVKSGVSKHGDSGKFDLVKNAAHHVSATPTPARLTSPVHVVLELVHFVVPLHHYAFVGADHGAHAAADASVSRVSPLPDAIEELVDVGGLFIQPHGSLYQPLAMDPQFNGMNRADGCASPTQAAFVFLPEDVPGQVLGA